MPKLHTRLNNINTLTTLSSPPPNPVPILAPFRSRIHRQACRRGGAGAGGGGRTCTFIIGVRVWSPSGDGRSGCACRTDIPLFTLSCVGRACEAHRVPEGAEAAFASSLTGTRPRGAGGRRGIGLAWQVRAAVLAECLVPQGGVQDAFLRKSRATGPTNPAPQRGPARAKTAERGAGRCHIT